MPRFLGCYGISLGFSVETSSFLLRKSTSLWFALLLMVDIALCQREGMSSNLEVVDSCRTLVTIIGVGVVFGGFEKGVILGGGVQ